MKQCICSAEYKVSQVAPEVKNLPANAGDVRYAGLIPGSRRFPGVGNGIPFQYSCLGNPMGIGAWWANPWDGRAGHD